MSTPAATFSEFSTDCEVRWADLDANAHARHTAYMDWATTCRLAAFAAVGLTMERLAELGVGPVIFREETDYLREVAGGDRITATFEMAGSSPDWKHWQIRHRLYRRDGVQCAVVVVRGAWMSLAERRVITPPAEIVAAAQRLPRAVDFTVMARAP